MTKPVLEQRQRSVGTHTSSPVTSHFLPAHITHIAPHPLPHPTPQASTTPSLQHSHTEEAPLPCTGERPFSLRLFAAPFPSCCSHCHQGEGLGICSPEIAVAPLPCIGEGRGKTCLSLHLSLCHILTPVPPIHSRPCNAPPPQPTPAPALAPAPAMPYPSTHPRPCTAQIALHHSAASQLPPR